MGNLNPKKQMEIDSKIIEETTKCDKNFECLKNKNYTCNTSIVDRAIGGRVHFINCSVSNCNYKMAFGNSYICNCPVRKEIFNKYHI